MDDKEYAPKQEILNRSSYERWFRIMTLKLKAKGVWYVVEMDKSTYIIVSTPATPETPTEGKGKDKVDEVTAGMAKLNIEKDSDKLAEKLTQYDKDEAVALYFILQGLSDEDAIKVDELIRAKPVWRSLTAKYCRSSPVEVTAMIQKIQTFEYTEEKGIHSGWAEMKEYCRRLGLADPAMKTAYPDPTLFAMFSMKLPDKYEAIIDGFRTTTLYTVDEKIKILADKEDSIKARTVMEGALAARNFRNRSRSRHYTSPRRHSHQSDSSDNGEDRIKCFVCDASDHIMRDCPFLDVARKAAKAEKKKSSSRSSSKRVLFDQPRKSSMKPYKKAKAMVAANNSEDDSTSEDVLDSETDAETETVLLSQDSISKHSNSWPADSACSTHMAHQPSCFRSPLVAIKRTPIQVGGGVLYARQKGTAEVRALDGTSMLVSNCLFVPDLGISLLSVRRLCEAGLKGEIDHKKLYLRRGKKTIIEATMTNGLYLVSHVALKGERQVAFASTEIDMQDVEETGSRSAEQEDKESKPLTSYSHKAPMGEAAIARYKLMHRRFSHLGPNKLRYLHEVTTLDKAIQIPHNLELCEVCSLTKIKNKIPKTLSPWKTAILALIQFDVAGPFPTSINGCNYFLLILDNATRKEWVIPMESKTAAIQYLRTWKLGVERKTEKLIKEARSDNAPELLKAVQGWKIHEGVELQSTTVASSHQNGPAERSIQTVEDDMRALLKEADLPLEFWDEAAKADCYVRNCTYNKLKLDGKRVCPEQAFSGEKPRIDHIRVWGYKCYFHENKKSMSKHERKDKLVNPGRVGVFMGYEEETTKHFRVYSPEHGRVVRRHVVRVNELVKGGTVELRLRCPTGPHGTPNTVADRLPVGRPKKDIPLVETLAAKSSSTPQVVVPLYQGPTNVPRFTEADMEDGDAEQTNQSARDNGETNHVIHDAKETNSDIHDTDPYERPTIRPQFNNESIDETGSPDLGNPRLVPSAPGSPRHAHDSASHMSTSDSDKIPTQEKAIAQSSTANARPVDSIPNIIEDTLVDLPTPVPSTTHQYFTRHLKRKREEDAEENERLAKVVRAMIAHLDEKDQMSLDNQLMIEEVLDYALTAKVKAGIPIPTTYKEAVNDPVYGKFWKQAALEETIQLLENNSWKEVLLPNGANLVDCKWVFDVKLTLGGGVERYKARLVARGFTQVKGEDYDQTFAPTVRMDTLRLFLAMVAKEDLECYQFDIKNAFTESHLKEKIYLKPPQGVDVKKGYVLEALRSLYGLKQAARDWNQLIRQEMRNWGFKQSLADPCLYTHAERGVKLLVYVDDIVATAKNKSNIDWFFTQLSGRFKAKPLGEISKILGSRVIRDRKNRTIYLDQEQYLSTILDRFGITQESHKKRSIPVPDYESMRTATPEDKRIDVTEYQQGVGCLMFAMVLTRPDIAFVLGKLAQFMSDPVEHHGHALKNLMRYLRSTLQQKIRYGPGGEFEYFTLYSDADWASDKSDRKSVGGYVVMFYGGPISWSSKKQRSVSTSSCESEYMALAMCAKQGQWVAQIFRDLGRPQYVGENGIKVHMMGDNQGAIALTENPHLHERSKHIDIAYHFIRDLVETQKAQVTYIPTAEMVADGMTKPLQRVAFERFKEMMGVIGSTVARGAKV